MAAKESVVPSTSPQAVGAEREKLRRERQQEFARRAQEYKDTME
ncbi:MAG: hypothetical protein QOD74_217, partial [Variibacter sp.]|nr:hypothetical protein [Variibacter sp.]